MWVNWKLNSFNIMVLGLGALFDPTRSLKLWAKTCFDIAPLRRISLLHVVCTVSIETDQILFASHR